MSRIRGADGSHGRKHDCASASKVQTIGQIIANGGGLAAQSEFVASIAAIEAAKPASTGKRIRVVAQEVKSLAEQSRQATASRTHHSSDFKRPRPPQ